MAIDVKGFWGTPVSAAGAFRATGAGRRITVVLAGENRLEFEQLCDDLETEWLPETRTEQFTRPDLLPPYAAVCAAPPPSLLPPTPTIYPVISMPRCAFKLRIRKEAIDEYEKEHQHVWPELLAKLKAVGISDYSIFRRGQDLFLYMCCEDFERAWTELDRDPVNQCWQQRMSRLFEQVPDIQFGERFAMMKEVFYLE